MTTMTTEDALVYAAIGFLVCVLALAALLWPVVRAWSRPTVDPVDDLIAANRATFRPGMGRPDWSAVDRAGQRRWTQTLQAQRRTQKPAHERITHMRRVR